MTNTPVADVKSYYAPAANKTADTGNNTKSAGYSFTNVMSETAGKSAGTQNMDGGVKQSQTAVEKPGRKDLDTQNTSADTAKEPAKVKDGKEIAKEVSGKTEEIKEAIKEELGVTDEEIEEAMKTLGISMQELLNPMAVQELMLTLSGTEDSLSLLTNAELYSSVKEIMQMAVDAGSEIKTEFALTDEEFAKLLNDKDFTQQLSPEKLSETNTEDAEPDAVKPADETMTAETGKETAAPAVKVEVTHTEATRTADPTAEGIQEQKPEAKGMAVSNVQSENTGKGQTEQGHENLAQMTQTTVTTNNVGDMVETVKQFAQSYVNGEELMQQVTEYMKVNISPDTISMEMQLHPASLGTINMQISAQNGVVTAQLLVQNEAVKAALETQLVQLQETFAEQGQKVEAVEVAVANYNLDRGPDQNQGEQSERQEAKAKGIRRRINLNDISIDGLEDLDEEEQLAAAVMDMNGNSVDFTA